MSSGDASLGALRRPRSAGARAAADWRRDHIRQQQQSRATTHISYYAHTTTDWTTHLESAVVYPTPTIHPMRSLS